MRKTKNRLRKTSTFSNVAVTGYDGCASPRNVFQPGVCWTTGGAAQEFEGGVRSDYEANDKWTAFYEATCVLPLPSYTVER